MTKSEITIIQTAVRDAKKRRLQNREAIEYFTEHNMTDMAEQSRNAVKSATGALVALRGICESLNISYPTI